MAPHVAPTLLLLTTVLKRCNLHGPSVAPFRVGIYGVAPPHPTPFGTYNVIEERGIG